MLNGAKVAYTPRRTPSAHSSPARKLDGACAQWSVIKEFVRNRLGTSLLQQRRHMRQSKPLGLRQGGRGLLLNPGRVCVWDKSPAGLTQWPLRRCGKPALKEKRAAPTTVLAAGLKASPDWA